VPERPGMHPMGKMAYLSLNAFLIRPPFAMMIFSEHPIYAIYELAPPPGGNALDDQQFAGVIMKIGLAWIMFAGVVAVFQAWRRAEQERVHPPLS
jgi:putative membrane protein